ncbi:MAG: hypothetical protein LUD76_08210 [Alistipes sp.]|nr:hypothetical protein [Alistipes sp.]
MDYTSLAEAIEYNIREKFPNESSKARLLSDTLGISETAVYQKLSGSRRFSLEEVASIARLFSVSVDRLLDRQPHRFSHPMELIYPGNMLEEEIAVYGEETAQSILEQASRAGYSKFTGVLKNLPPVGYCNFEWLMKFSQLKWIYLNNSVDDIAPLTGIKVPGEFDSLSRIAGKAFNSFRTLLFIIDGDIVRNQIKEVQFFFENRTYHRGTGKVYHGRYGHSFGPDSENMPDWLHGEPGVGDRNFLFRHSALQ